MHNETHPSAGDFFYLELKGTRCMPLPEYLDTPFRVLDWADRLGLLENYTREQKDFAFNNFLRRRMTSGLPNDDKVVYGQLREGILLLVHETELVI